MAKRISDQQFTLMVQHAMATDAERERLESAEGFAPPKRCDLHSHLRTVEQALECAVKVNDWQTVCEGIVLLRQAIARITSPRAASPHTH